MPADELLDRAVDVACDEHDLNDVADVERARVLLVAELSASRPSRGIAVVAALVVLAAGAWALLWADSDPSGREIADALNAKARTFSASCRSAAQDLFRCQTTRSDGRIADYRVAVDSRGCWVATSQRARALLTGCDH